MTITAKPEVLRPGIRTGRPGAQLFDDENLNWLSHLLDDFLHIPGTRIRFGLDGIVGFIPGVGDLLGGLASTVIIIAAWSRGVPAVVLVRMLLNLLVETVIGSVPVLGNLFDIGWKANRRNYALLRTSLEQPDRQRTRSWLILAALTILLFALVLLPVFLLGWIVAHLAAPPSM